MKESYPKICHKYVLSSSLRDLNCFRPIRVRIKRPKTKPRIRFFSETDTGSVLVTKIQTKKCLQFDLKEDSNKIENFFLFIAKYVDV